MKDFYNALEIANFLGKSRFWVSQRAKKDKWLNRKRVGKGGGVEYAFEGLPKDVQAEIKALQVKAEMKALTAKVDNSASRAIALLERDTAELTHAQRETADARLLMTLLVAQFELKAGGKNRSRTKAIEIVSKLSRENALPVNGEIDYNKVCATAVAKAKAKSGIRGVGTRKLHEWCLLADKCETGEDRLKVLAPQKQGQPVVSTTRMEWLPDFMAIYRSPKGYHVAEAYRIFAVGYEVKHGAENVPHIDVVYRALDKLPRLVRESGRVTGSKLKTLMTYVKRDWNTSWFNNNDVWVGDGKSMEFKVKHPEHGQPFTPELTIIMDTTCRFVVGWSVAYAESTLAVADALRDGMVKHGIPAIYYSDNGSGQTNKALDADLMGILPRLGVHHETGIPGNPQGRGIIERFNKVVPRWIAQQFETYWGQGADDETVRKNLYAVTSFAKAEKEGRTELTPIQKKGQKIYPTWKQFIDVVEQAVAYYNNEWEHSELGTTPSAYREALMDKMAKDGVDIIPLTEVEARDMFRPHFVRKVQRGWLSVLNNEYWHKALEALDGVEVVAYVDIHDASSVIIRHGDGRYVCDAVLDGNKRDAFPKTLVEQSREARAKRRLKKVEEEAYKAKAELKPAIELEKLATLSELVVGSDVKATDDLIMHEWRAKAIKLVK
nr:transposase [Moraxella osloensis]